jgi:hypothetical protein
MFLLFMVGNGEVRTRVAKSGMRIKEIGNVLLKLLGESGTTRAVAHWILSRSYGVV